MNPTPTLPETNQPTGSPERADLRPESINDAVIRLAGDSQDGIQSAGAFLARLAGRSAQDVMTYMTIPATISGGPSIFQVRMGTGEVLSAGDEADFLVAFYQHSYQDHIGFLKEGGVLLYDSDNVQPNLDDKRFVYVGVPITGLTVEALGGTAKDKGKNIFVLGLISKIFNLDIEKLTTLINEKFAGKDASIANTAIMAFTAGYAYPVGNVLTKQYKFEVTVPKEGDRAQITMDGNQALAYGLIAAGVRYGAGYPITPWSSVMEILRGELPKYGGIFVQAEDELGAVSIALGFSFSGYLAVTGSAGPGISLKTEAIGWASMSEMPLIIINVQRGGPSTGLPTNVEQSDLYQAIFGGHGDSPRVVLAAATVEDCFYTRDRGGSHRPQIQHASFCFERHFSGDTDRSVRRTGAEGFDDRPETGSFAARFWLQALRGRSDHATCHARRANDRREISPRVRTRTRRDGPSDRQPEVAHGHDGETPQQIAQARRGNPGARGLWRSG